MKKHHFSKNSLRKIILSQYIIEILKLLQLKHTNSRQNFLLVTFYSLLVTFYSLLVTVYSLLVAFYSLLVTFYSLLVTFYSLLVAFYSLLVTFYSSLVNFYSLLFTRNSLVLTCYSLLLTGYLLRFILLALHYIHDVHIILCISSGKRKYNPYWMLFLGRSILSDMM